MQIANAWLKVNDLGSNVQVLNITPAEALILREQFGQKIKGQPMPSNPLSHLDITSETDKRTNEAEYMRLVGKFGEEMVKKCFPGTNPQMPEKFDSMAIAESGKPLPKEPEKGKEQKITPLPTKRDSGADLEAASAAQAQIEQLQAQVAALTKQLTTPTEKKVSSDAKKP